MSSSKKKNRKNNNRKNSTQEGNSNSGNRNIVDLRGMVLRPTENVLWLKDNFKSTARRVLEYPTLEEVKEEMRDVPKHHYWIFAVMLLLFISLGTYNALTTKADVTHFFAESCLGTWKDSSNAQGEPDAQLGSADSFNENNSAILFPGQLGEMFCGSFSGEVPRGTTPQKATLKFSWFWKDAEYQQEESPDIFFDRPSGLQEEEPEETEELIEETEEMEETGEDQEPSEPLPTEEEEIVDEVGEADEVGEESVDEVGEEGLDEEIMDEVDEESTDEVEEESVDEIDEENADETDEENESGDEQENESGDEQENGQEDGESENQEGNGEGQEQASVTREGFANLIFQKVFANEENGDNTEEENADETEGESVDEADEENADETGEADEKSTTDETGEEEMEEEKFFESKGLLEIKYTFDGEEWINLGTVGKDNWQEAEFDLPVVNWQRMSEIQIGLFRTQESRAEETFLSLEEGPIIFLDALWIEITYREEKITADPSSEEIELLKNLPKRELNWRERLINPRTSFKAGERVFFEFNISDLVEDADLTSTERGLDADNTDEDDGSEKEKDPMQAKTPESVVETEKTDEDEEVDETEEEIVDEVGEADEVGEESVDEVGEEGLDEEIMDEVDEESTDEVEEESVDEIDEENADETDEENESGDEQENGQEDGESENQEGNGEGQEQVFWRSFLKTAFAQPFSEERRDQELTVLSSKVLNPKGEELDLKPVIEEVQGRLRVEMPEMGRDFNPGQYHLEAEFVYKGELFVLNQDFTLGVLAVNLNKSIFTLGDAGYFQMAALTDTGDTICDADLELELFEPDGVTQTFTTSNGSIFFGDECGPNNVTDEPDYFFYKNLFKTGDYEITLTNLDNGYFIEDSFEVRNQTNFDVERVGATRINPFEAAYQMSILVTPEDDFEGKVIEEVPSSFEIISDGSFEVEESGGSKFISWQSSIEAGEKKELFYTYQAPEISPQFYLLGPLKIYQSKEGFLERLFPGSGDLVFQEAREWQIASDADEGPNFPNTVVNDSGIGTVSWSSPSNVEGNTSSEAFAIINNSATNYLKATDFGFSIPTNTVIEGIKIEWEKNTRFGTSTTQDNAIRIVKGGVIGSEDKSTGAQWPSSAAYTTYGGESDLWGETWTASDINSSNFGAALSAIKTDTGDEQVQVSRVRITVYYSVSINISGNVYDDLDTTSVYAQCDGSTENISLVIDGGTALTTTCDDTTGAYSFEVPGNDISSEDPVSVFINQTDKGVTVALADGEDMENFHVEKDTVRLSDKGSATALTNTHLSHCDDGVTGCGNVPYDVTTGDLTVESGINTVIESGRTLNPGGGVSVDDIEIAGTLTAPGSTDDFNVSGSFINSGTFTHNSGTTTFNATSTGKTINSGGSNFNNVTFDGSGGGWSPATSTMIVVGDLIMKNGSFNNDNGTADVEVRGNVECDTTCGTINMTSANTFTLNSEVSRNFGTNVATSVDWTFFNLAFNHPCTSFCSPVTITTNANGTGSIIVENNLSLASAGGETLALNNNTNDRILEVAGDVSIGSSITFSASSSSLFTVGGDWTNSGTFTHNNGTVTFNSTSTGKTINSGGSNFNNVTFDGSGGGWSPRTNTMTIVGNLIMKNGSFNTDNGTADVTVNGHVECDTTCGTINMTSANTFTLNSEVSRNFGTNVATSTDWTFNHLTFNAPCTGFCTNPVTVTFNGTGTGDIIVGGNFSTTSAGSTTLILNNNTNDRILEVAGDVSIGTDTTFQSSSSALFTVGGSWSNSGTFTHNSGTVTFNSTSTGKTINSGGSNFNNVTFDGSGGGWSPATSTMIVVGDLIMKNGSFNTDNGTADVEVRGNVECDTTCGTINMTSTNTFTQSVSGNRTFGTNVAVSTDWTFYNLTFSAFGGTPTITFNGTGTGKIITNNDFTTSNFGLGAFTVNNNTNDRILEVAGDVSVGSSTTFSASSSSLFTVGGDWTNSGTFTHNSGTVTFDGTGSKNITDGGSAFHNIIFNGAGSDWLYLDGSTTAPNSTVVDNGEATFLNAKTGSVTVNGGTLNVDWYLAVKTVALDNTDFDIEIADGDITISENSTTPKNSIFRHDGANWGTASSTQVTSTGGDGFNPQPNSAGAIRVREYQETSSGIEHYRYNLEIVAQDGFDSYNFQDLTGKYLVSSQVTPVSDEAAVISESWYRSTTSSPNSFVCSAGSGDGCLNEPPNEGSWYIGMTSDLILTVDSATANLGALNFSNDFTSNASTTLSVSTSFAGGYTITAYASHSGQLKLDGESVFISAWSGTNANPTSWDGNCKDDDECGFGYTTSDSNLAGGTADRFTDHNFCSAEVGNQCYAGFVGSGPGDPVADNTSAVPGGEDTTITYQVSALLLQQPGNYSTTVFYIGSANY